MRIVFSWDDGAPEDQKLFELHEKYRIPGMFFVPTRNREGRDVIKGDIIRRSKSEFIDFGGHTKNHVYLTEVSLLDVDEEVKDNKEYLEDLLGQEVKHFCFPGGRYNQEILNVVKRHYKTARTADTMNFINNDKFLIKPSIHFYPRGKKSIIGNCIRNKSYKELLCVLQNIHHSDFDVYKRIIYGNMKKKNKDIIIWGHSWEIEELNCWDRLEKIMAFVKKECKDEVVYYDELFSKTGIE